MISAVHSGGPVSALEALVSQWAGLNELRRLFTARLNLAQHQKSSGGRSIGWGRSVVPVLAGTRTLRHGRPSLRMDCCGLPLVGWAQSLIGRNV